MHACAEVATCHKAAKLSQSSSLVDVRLNLPSVVYCGQLTIDSGITLAALVEGSLTMLPQAPSKPLPGRMTKPGVPLWRSLGVASSLYSRIVQIILDL